jgi:hypothetical protein
MFKVAKPCACGSGETRRELIDARGIFCTFVCDVCEDEKRAQYRADIFEDDDYWTDEPVEPEGRAVRDGTW